MCTQINKNSIKKAHVLIIPYVFLSCKTSDISFFDVLKIEVFQMTWVEVFYENIIFKMQLYK